MLVSSSYFFFAYYKKILDILPSFTAMHEIRTLLPISRSQTSVCTTLYVRIVVVPNKISFMPSFVKIYQMFRTHAHIHNSRLPFHKNSKLAETWTAMILLIPTHDKAFQRHALSVNRQPHKVNSSRPGI